LKKQRGSLIVVCKVIASQRGGLHAREEKMHIFFASSGNQSGGNVCKGSIPANLKAALFGIKLEGRRIARWKIDVFVPCGV
jgi:hypothetical protein